MISSARGKGVPVAAASWNKQESARRTRLNWHDSRLAGFLEGVVTIMQQFDCNPQIRITTKWKCNWEFVRRVPRREHYFFSSLAIRCASRETFRREALRGTIPFCAARIKAGSASVIAASAPARSPAAIASSTLHVAERMRERRDLLTTARRSAWRAAFFADLVLAIAC